ncbi:MAG TPA: NAD(P)/FAD-dependent oxidoreductase [Anaerolineales bacterium]|nr:NAD(P)/FAD-dependent oxidoreductase [Anaerolineales bacterium]
MLERDIIIIGGGPSGLSAALHLARDFPHLIPRTLILEKARYPRPKLCAGGLVIDAEVILQHLGLDVTEVPHVDADYIRFDFEAKGLNVHVPRRHALRVIRRVEFDNWLAQKTESRGIEIRQGVVVRNIIPDENGVTVETDQGDFRARVVVGADGSNGVTRRCLFPNAPVNTARVLEVLTPERHVVASETKLSPRTLGVASGESAPRHDIHQERIAYFDFFPVPSNIAGYVWDFPTQVNGQAMRCWGIYDTNLLASEKRPQLKEPLAKEMRRLGFDLNNYEIQGYPIRWFSPEHQISVPRALLVGDAAGADPFLGEGISIALGYGALAAREIGEAFRRNEFSFNGYRRRVLSSALGQVLITRWVVAQIVYLFKWKWFQILVWRILKPLVFLVAWLFVLNWGRRV